MKMFPGFVGRGRIIDASFKLMSSVIMYTFAYNELIYFKNICFTSGYNIGYCNNRTISKFVIIILTYVQG